LTVVIVFLGTSAATPTRSRGLPSIALKLGGEVLLFDVGEGTQHRMMAAGISPLRVSAIFITHLHGDHFFGLPGLLQSMAMNNRVKPLLIYGPPGISSFLEAVFKASGFQPPFQINVKEGLSLEYRADRYVVESFQVCHTGRPALGYRYREKDKPGNIDVRRALKLGLKPGPLYRVLKEGRPVIIGGRVIRPEDVVGPPHKGLSIVYTGDTRPCSSVVEFSRGAKVLIHESTFTSDYEEEAWEEGHSTARDAARIARAAGVGLLVLTHISARYQDSSLLLSEASSIYPFTLVAEDYMHLAIRGPW